MKVARLTVVVIGIIAIIGGIVAQNQNVAFLVALAFAVAASANLPTILYSLFWRRFNTAGALWSMYGGLVLVRAAHRLLAGRLGRRRRRCSRTPTSRIFPLSNPGIVSIPLAFVLGIVGTLVSKPWPTTTAKQAEMEVRSFTVRERLREGSSSS